MVIPELKLTSKVLSTNLGFFNPFELNFAITYKCNSKCTICNIWKEKGLDELSLEEIEKFSKKINFVHWMRLTGGEPFLRKDYVNIVKILNDNLTGLYLITTATNGLLPDLIHEKVKKVLEFLKKRYIITVSLDGPEKIHEKIRGVEGSWNKAIETYKKLKSLEKKYKNFKVFFGYTISPLNLGFFKRTLNDVKRLIPKIKANDFHVNLFQTSDVYYKNEGVFLDKKYFVDAINELDSILKLRGKPKNYLELIENKYLELGKKYLKTHKIPIKCNIFNLSCFIDPFGNVFPCTILNYSLGNLRENDYDLYKILSSDNAKKIKEKIMNGECPQCWTPCEAHQIILSNWLKT
jgi:MoaA/NifB/PqqE/SkfB family radical SAM enzyme